MTAPFTPAQFFAFVLAGLAVAVIASFFTFLDAIVQRFAAIRHHRRRRGRRDDDD